MRSFQSFIRSVERSVGRSVRISLPCLPSCLSVSLWEYLYQLLFVRSATRTVPRSWGTKKNNEPHIPISVFILFSVAGLLARDSNIPEVVRSSLEFFPFRRFGMRPTYIPLAVQSSWRKQNHLASSLAVHTLRTWLHRRNKMNME